MTEDEQRVEIARIRKAQEDYVADMLARGVSPPPSPDVPRLGSFAEDDPEAHEAMRDD